MMSAAIHDPLYGTVHVDDIARRLVDTPAFQRLGRIRQLQMASIVYRSAVHTRFGHAVGAYHLAKRAIRRLAETGQLTGVTEDDIRLVPIAALVHDVGHHFGAHVLEEAGLQSVDHEQMADIWLKEGQIAEILNECGIPDAADRIAAIIRHEGTNPLREIVAGPCDVDKIDYIARDAYHCGLPLGFNRDELLDGFVLITNPSTGEKQIGLHESALAAFEQLLYSKFNLYRAVYFHPTVRSATVMTRELVLAALEAGLLELDELRIWTDEEIFILLGERVMRRRRSPEQREIVGRLIERIQARNLYEPVIRFPLSSAPDLSVARLREIEAELVRVLGLERGDVLIDIPHKPTMLSTDVLILREDGSIVNAGELGPDDGFALGPSAEAFYHASGRWGLYVSDASAVSRDVARDALLELIGETGGAR